MNYYISDTHFGHENIIRFDKRPFCNIEEMENTLIDNWNSVVDNGDTVYILGDFCWGKEEEWRRILKLLKGNKVLIQGNHDLKKMSSELNRMFQDIKQYKEIKDNERKVIMCHYPLMFYRGAHNPITYMLCGHVHTTRENNLLVKWRQEMLNTKVNDACSCANIINVGCMMPWMNYAPRTLDEIIDGDTEYTSLLRKEPGLVADLN